jgi:uncharacterized protein YegP (UPF0339 family)
LRVSSFLIFNDGEGLSRYVFKRKNESIMLTTSIYVLSQEIAEVTTLGVIDASVAFEVLDVPFNDCGLRRNLEVFAFRSVRMQPPFGFLPMQ